MKATANETNGFATAAFRFPQMALPGFGEFAERGLARAQEGCERMKSASEAMADTLRHTYSSNASGATDYGLKVIEISSANTASAIDFFAELLGSKSMTDVLAVSTAQARRAFETTAAQNKELWELAQKVATQTSEPIRKHVANVLQQAR